MTVSQAEVESSSTPFRISDVYLEQEGRRRIERVIAAVETVPWSVSLLQLAWTAGPVTYIAALGGYYIGYGKALPTDTLVFFVGYTIIAGVVGLLARLIHGLWTAPRHRVRDQALTQTIDELPEFIFAVRDLSLQNLAPEARRREAAWILLRKGELGPDSVAMAVQDLTDSARLAQTARQIEAYRRAGLHQRVQDLVEADAPQIQLVLQELNANLPDMADTLRCRLEGRAPTLQDGVPREEHFIERIFAAIEEDNDALMTLRDVEEMLVLAFELVNGRRIPVLGFSYEGRWRLARATDALEQARADFRIAQATGYSRLKALATFLAENDDAGIIDGAAGQSSEQLAELCRRNLDSLAERLYRLRVEIHRGRLSEAPSLAELTTVMDTALELYGTTLESYQDLERRHHGLIKARSRWEAVSARYEQRVTALRTGHGRKGLRIREGVIALDDKQKLAVAMALAQHFQRLTVRRHGGRMEVEWAPVDALSVDRAKQLAIRTALILEPHVHLSRTQVQRAINSANAPHLGLLEPGLSAEAKAAFGAAMAKEVRKDMGRAAEQLASALVRYYHIELTETAIGFLHETYGADPEKLRVLAEFNEHLPAVVVNRLRRRPDRIPALEPNWRHQLHRSRALMERVG